MKTYVVAGDTVSGTSVMMAAHFMGGIDMLTRSINDPVRFGRLREMVDQGIRDETFLQEMAKVTPYASFECNGKIEADEVRGRVIKRFYTQALTNLPKEIDNMHIVYMHRDWAARWRANPKIDGNIRADTSDEEEVIRRTQEDYLKRHIGDITTLSASPRVANLIVYDFDWVIDNPERAMKILCQKGWEFDPVAASRVFRSEMRHAKKREWT